MTEKVRPFIDTLAPHAEFRGNSDSLLQIGDNTDFVFRFTPFTDLRHSRDESFQMIRQRIQEDFSFLHRSLVHTAMINMFTMKDGRKQGIWSIGHRIEQYEPSTATEAQARIRKWKTTLHGIAAYLDWRASKNQKGHLYDIPYPEQWQYGTVKGQSEPEWYLVDIGPDIRSENSLADSADTIISLIEAGRSPVDASELGEEITLFRNLRSRLQAQGR